MSDKPKSRGGWKQTEEAKRKISEARRRRKESLGFLNSPAARAKMAAAKLGKPQPPEVVARRAAKCAETKRGIYPPHFAAMRAAGQVHDAVRGEDHGQWKGDDVGYNALHAWVQRMLGRPAKCSRCGAENAKRYEWANVSKEYRRDVTDWIRLCVSCHRKDGFACGEYKAWNKGRKVQTNTGRTHFKKGQRISRLTESRPAIVPHNKRLKPLACATCGDLFQPKNSKQKFCRIQCYWSRIK